jgi:diadenosine tetraphosphate (Ap4A) HIT family hydrolase
MNRAMLTKNDKKNPLFFEEISRPDMPLKMSKGPSIEEPVFVRSSKLNPGHVSLIARHRMMRGLPEKVGAVSEEDIDLDKCKFCHPSELCAEAEDERTRIYIDKNEFILASNPYYYLPGHAVLFPFQGPHKLSEAKEGDWRVLVEAGAKAASARPGFRFGFNAGTYLCCGGSQRHLHLQMVPLKNLAPNEEALLASLPDGISFERLEAAFQEKGLVVEEAEAGGAFLAASWAPRFNLELVAVFSRARRFVDMERDDLHTLARWIHETASRFVVPQGGGLNGFGLEVPDFPFMVRIIPRLPGAVQAFMETGAGCMVISYLPESIPELWEKAG